MFNNNVISSADSHKHLVIILDSKLSFINHLKETIFIANKGIAIIRRIYYIFFYLDSHIYKAYVRPYLDYGDVIRDLIKISFSDHI